LCRGLSTAPVLDLFEGCPALCWLGCFGRAGSRLCSIGSHDCIVLRIMILILCILIIN
jgi:hypothetical protein